MSIRFACAVCRRIITDWRASVLPDGRLELQARCHGQVFSIIQLLDLQGVLFSDRPILDLESRFPDDWTGPKEGPAVDRGASGRGRKSRWTENATLAALGE